MEEIFNFYVTKMNEEFLEMLRVTIDAVFIIVTGLFDLSL